MKMIEMLTDYIDEELDDAYKYIKKANEFKDSDPEIASMFYKLSNDEMTHMDMLHKRVVETIMAYKRQNGAPPAAMEEAYNLLHKRHMAKGEKVTSLQNMYKR